MIYPAHKKWALSLIWWYAKRILKNDFSAIRVFGEYHGSSKSTLVIGNHSTWWDGFWGFYLNKVILKKKFHVLMLEKELAPRKFFAKCGAYSINPDVGKIKDSLMYTKKLLEARGNFVLFFPEGKFSPQAETTKAFEKGISYFYKTDPEFETFFVAFMTDYFDKRKPTLSIYLKQETFSAGAGSIEIQEKYNIFFAKCLQKQKELAC